MVSITFKKINPPNYFLTQSRYHSCRCGQKLSHFQINEPGNVFQGSWGFLTVLAELFELLSTRKVTNTLWGASAEPWRRPSFDNELRENLVNNQSNSLGFTPPNPLFRNILALRGFWGFPPPPCVSQHFQNKGYGGKIQGIPLGLPQESAPQAILWSLATEP